MAASGGRRVIEQPETRYAKNGDLYIAHQVVGEADRGVDLVMVPGSLNTLQNFWQVAELRRFVDRLASFARVVLLDKRGTGLSDRLGPGEVPSDPHSGTITPEVGITATPVIDPTTNTMYVVAMSKLVSGSSTTYIQRIHTVSGRPPAAGDCDDDTVAEQREIPYSADYVFFKATGS